MRKRAVEVLTSLELAETYLEEVRQQLIHNGSLLTAVEPALSRAANLLQSARDCSLDGTDGEAFRALLTSLSRKAARAQLLLDSAAANYCGINLAGPVVEETYSPDGSWQITYPTDQICLSA